MDQLIDEVVKVAGTALAGVAIWALTQLARKYGFQVSAERHAQLEAAARQAILVVEEKAAAALKARAAKLSPAEKLEGAVAIVLQKMPGITADEAADIVHAQLPVVRGAAVDFSKAVLRSATNRGGRR
jgi:light-regulated signal transduction histidine kinase (bacteriophytochrome)